MANEDALKKDRKVIIRGQIDTGMICPAGKDYCWECGWIDWPATFLENNRCPNLRCLHPDNWND